MAYEYDANLVGFDIKSKKKVWMNRLLNVFKDMV